MIKKDDKYLGFGCQKFSLFVKDGDNNYKIKHTGDNVEFANIILIESEYLYLL